MTKPLFVFFALCLMGGLPAPFSAAAPAAPMPLAVTLPLSADPYSYWVQSKDGPVSVIAGDGDAQESV